MQTEQKKTPPLCQRATTCSTVSLKLTCTTEADIRHSGQIALEIAALCRVSGIYYLTLRKRLSYLWATGCTSFFQFLSLNKCQHWGRVDIIAAYIWQPSHEKAPFVRTLIQREHRVRTLERTGAVFQFQPSSDRLHGFKWKLSTERTDAVEEDKVAERLSGDKKHLIQT